MSHAAFYRRRSYAIDSATRSRWLHIRTISPVTLLCNYAAIVHDSLWNRPYDILLQRSHMMFPGTLVYYCCISATFCFCYFASNFLVPVWCDNVLLQNVAWFYLSFLCFFTCSGTADFQQTLVFLRSCTWSSLMLIIAHHQLNWLTDWLNQSINATPPSPQ